MKQKILDVLIPAALLGILGTGLQTWREVGILQTEIGHLREEVDRLQTFVASDDPREFHKAKKEIQEDLGKH
jgi:hypothetical protein